MSKFEDCNIFVGLLGWLPGMLVDCPTWKCFQKSFLTKIWKMQIQASELNGSSYFTVSWSGSTDLQSQTTNPLQISALIYWRIDYKSYFCSKPTPVTRLLIKRQFLEEITHWIGCQWRAWWNSIFLTNKITTLQVNFYVTNTSISGQSYEHSTYSRTKINFPYSLKLRDCILLQYKMQYLMVSYFKFENLQRYLPKLNMQKFQYIRCKLSY